MSNGVRNSNPSAIGGRGQRVDDVAGKGTSDVQACERAKLLKWDLIVERGLNAQRAHEHMSEHGAVGHGFDCVGVGRERATQVSGLLNLAEQQFDEPAQSIGLNDLASRKLASWHGGQVPADGARGVGDADESEANDVLACAPNHVEIEDRAATLGDGSELVVERPIRNVAQGSVDNMSDYSHLCGLLESH